MIVAFLFCSAFWSRGQSISPFVFNTTGTTLNGNNVQFEFSFGEPITTTLTTNTDLMTQGLLQPNYNLMTSIHIEHKNITVNYYPNPTTDNIYIETDAAYHTVQIFDMAGQLVNYHLGQSQKLSFEYLAAGLYEVVFLDQSGNRVTHFKVSKITY